MKDIGVTIDAGLESDPHKDAHHYDGLLSAVDGVVVDHADNGHAEVAANAEGDAKTKTGEDSDNVAARQPEACAVHDGQLFLIHHLRPSLRRQLNSLAIFLALLEDPGGRMRAHVDVPL